MRLVAVTVALALLMPVTSADRHAGTSAADPKPQLFSSARAETFTPAIIIATIDSSAQERSTPAACASGNDSGAAASNLMPPAARAGAKAPTSAHTQVVQTLAWAGVGVWNCRGKHGKTGGRM